MNPVLYRCRDSLIRLMPMLVLMLMLVTARAVGSAEDRPLRRPNVIVILADDQGWGDLSINGNENLNTPNIDRIAREGARWDRFFVCPVCSPTRAEFLTGRYHPRSSVYSTSAGGERMDLDEVTLADTFHAAGYATAAFGKWHNGMQYPYHPNGRGFAEFYGFCSGHWGNYFSPILEHNGRIVQGSGFCVDDFTGRLLRFVEQNRDRPFLAYLALNTPHSPMQVPDEYWNRFRDHPLPKRHREPDRENVEHTRAALAMCENIDWNVGRILQQLEELKLERDTIVVYFSDNGPNGFRWNGRMKGRKGSTDEGGVRSPLHVRYPARIRPATVVRPIGAAIDLLPTLAELCDVPLIASRQLDGQSLVPLLIPAESLSDEQLQSMNKLSERMIVSHWRDRISVRSQRYRLSHEGQLFDMWEDPEQSRDVGDQLPKIREQLEAVAQDYRKTVLSEMDRQPRPFLIGHPDSQVTQMPARDAVPRGEIKRSNKFPNCSYLTHWRRLADQITWDAEVLEAGDYEVTVYYTCPAESVGAEFELRFQDQTLAGRITTAHDPPLQGPEHDRIERVESYVKSFRPLKMGTIRLSPGRGQLTLQATRIPGPEVMDFRLLLLEKK